MGIKNRIVINFILRLLPVLLCFQNLNAQSYIADVRKLSVEEGLSNRFVNFIYKDSHGFIWIGTKYGLNRYDGYTFKLYTAENSALTINDISKIGEDKAQKLWIFGRKTTRDVNILDLNTGRIQNFDQAFKDLIPIRGEDIANLYCDTERTIWITTLKGNIYRYRDKRFELVLNLSEYKKRSILYADEHFLWTRLTTAEGKEKILKVNLANREPEEIDLQKDTEIIEVDKDNTLWLFQPLQKKLVRIPEKDPVQTIDLPSLELPEDIYTNTSQRKCYINPSNGLIWWFQRKNRDTFFVFHPREGIVYNLQPEIAPFLTYKTDIIYILYFDTENRAWLATRDGIFIITLKKDKFTRLLSGTSETYSTRGIVKDNIGNLYINTYNGRVIKGPEKEEIKKNKDAWLGTAKDREGNIWFAQGVLMEKYNPLNGQSQYYDYRDKSNPDSPWTVMCDKTGIIWIGTYRGLYFVEPETGRYKKFVTYNDFSQLGDSSIFHLSEDEEGIWIGTSLGLYLLEPGKGLTRRYASTESPPRYIPYDFLLHFYRDPSGIFWIATQGGGLIRFNPEDGSYRQFTTAEGLSSNIIYAVYGDDYGKLWLSSNYGLMQFDKKSFLVNTYLVNDGITHNEFNTASHYRDADGRLYFGSLAGVTTFHPRDFITKDLVYEPLKITDFQVFNRKTETLIDKTLTMETTGKIELFPSDTFLTLEFALLNYEYSHQNKYTYKIEGLDKNWTTLQGNTLRINTLPYGNYVLHIKGRGIKGENSAGELAVPISVYKPFYLENWFIAACIFVAGLLIYIIFRLRLQQLKRAKSRLEAIVVERTLEIKKQKDKIEADKDTIEEQAQQLKELDSVKSRFFANISHELRTPLTLILGPLNHLVATLKNDKSPPAGTLIDPLAVMQRNSKKLLQLIEEILDLSKLEARKLEVEEKPIAFYTFIKNRFAIFESHASKRNIRYRLFYEPDKSIHLLIDPKKTEKIITNFLSNAFKYSPDDASISLKVNEEDNFIRITVTDNGPGIHPDDLPYVFDRFYQSKHTGEAVQGGTGIGLALCKELAHLMGGEVEVQSRWGEGSAFSYTWPKKEVTSTSQKEHPEATSVPEPASLPEATEASKTKAPATKTGKNNRQPEKQTVLIVEDHEDMRRFIADILLPHYHIQTAGDGKKALALLNQKEPLPDIILSDVMMPNMDGFTLLHQLKAHPVWQQIPVILLTARAAQEDRLHGLTRGVDDYLTKPFDAPELLARMHNLLDNYRERKQWQKKAVPTIAAGEPPKSWDTEWLQQVQDIVEREIVNHKYKVTDLAAEMYISKSQLLTKMKQITGLTPNEFIREIKLQKARLLLENHVKSTIAEVAYAIGFDTPEYFSKVYENHFGKRPSAYFTDK